MNGRKRVVLHATVFRTRQKSYLTPNNAKDAPRDMQEKISVFDSDANNAFKAVYSYGAIVSKSYTKVRALLHYKAFRQRY